MITDFLEFEDATMYKYKRIIFAVMLIGCFVGGGLFLYQYVLTEPSTVGEVVEEPSTDTATASSSALSVFRLTLVPEATSSILLSLPIQTENLKKADRAAYDKARESLQTQIEAGLVPNSDNPYFLEVQLVSSLRELQQSDSAALLYQVQDELLALTQYYNEVLQATSTVGRGVADAVVAPYEAAVYTTAPSSHIVVALFMGDVLKKSDLLKAADVDAAVTAMIMRGVAYGLYSDSDIAVSKSLYTQYKTLLLKDYPELSNSF